MSNCGNGSRDHRCSTSLQKLYQWNLRVGGRQGLLLMPVGYIQLSTPRLVQPVPKHTRRGLPKWFADPAIRVLGVRHRSLVQRRCLSVLDAGKSFMRRQQRDGAAECGPCDRVLVRGRAFWRALCRMRARLLLQIQALRPMRRRTLGPSRDRCRPRRCRRRACGVRRAEVLGATAQFCHECHGASCAQQSA